MTTTPLLNNCSTCSNPVEGEEKAIQCNFCESWEHLSCVREVDRPSEEMYAAMTTCSVKCILYYCSRCRSKGSINKRLLQLELENTRANESTLASERLLSERQITLTSLQRERDELARDKADLIRELQTLKRSMTWSGKGTRTEEVTNVPTTRTRVT